MHRDVAARNVLVGEGSSCKIGQLIYGLWSLNLVRWFLKSLCRVDHRSGKIHEVDQDVTSRLWMWIFLLSMICDSFFPCKVVEQLNQLFIIISIGLRWRIAYSWPRVVLLALWNTFRFFSSNISFSGDFGLCRQIGKDEECYKSRACYSKFLIFDLWSNHNNKMKIAVQNCRKLHFFQGGRLPLKWMSPEAIRDYEFSTKSDV